MLIRACLHSTEQSQASNKTIGKKEPQHLSVLRFFGIKPWVIIAIRGLRSSTAIITRSSLLQAGFYSHMGILNAFP